MAAVFDLVQSKNKSILGARESQKVKWRGKKSNKIPYHSLEPEY